MTLWKSGALFLLVALSAVPARTAETITATAPPKWLDEETSDDDDGEAPTPCRFDGLGGLLQEPAGRSRRASLTMKTGRTKDGPFTFTQTDPEGSGHYSDIGVSIKVGAATYGFCFTTATPGWRHVALNRSLANQLFPIIRSIQDVDGDHQDELVIMSSISVHDGSLCGEGPDCAMWVTAFDRRGQTFVVDAASTRKLRTNLARAYQKAAGAKRGDAEDLKHYAEAAALLTRLTNDPAQNERSVPSVTLFETAEEAAAYVKKASFSEATFVLDLTDDHTFAGRADKQGAGLAVVVDAVLAKGFSPDGFQQMDGYRVYRYKKSPRK